ncbi:hypothetical protein BDZ90DRAFT_233656 [Jaminaea rosea]|uniref:Ras GEF n=1 Tax=Jaminaea rosea TaxID=1569628 RepID=A0A316UNZ3_9BASI|nr:hypothetical protein BDZ90DRAFT_233656 [Jaminaea rosea]PWN26071.1 hypothetical protein BDZ90DRAFT_233656 [Jaminaea rosea]
MSYSPSDEEDPPSFFVRALYTYTATDKSSLSFERGDIIEVLTQLPTGWWDGILCDQRGWFPSNYVETIDEETAQRELDEREMALGLKPTLDFDVADDEEADIRAVDALAAAGGHTQATTGLESALSLSTATYPNDGDFSAALGLGQDFAALRELMGTGEGGAGLPGVDGNATDAFEQLAEAAMLDAGRDPELAAEDGEAPPAMTASGRNPDIDLTGAPSRSMAQTDSFGRPRASTALEPQRSANGSNDWQSRGRAASAAGPQSRQQQQQPTQQSAKPAIQKKAAAAKESDYWVPKFTDGGDIVYYNTRTGAESVDLPDGADDSGDEELDEASGSRSASVPDITARRGQADTRSNGSPAKPAASRQRSSTELRPPRMLRDEKEAKELQKLVQTRGAKSLPLMISQAGTALARLEQESERRHSSSQENGDGQPEDSDDDERIRLVQASHTVINALRDLLYAAGVLNVSPADLATIAELASLQNAEGGSSGNAMSMFADSVVFIHSQSDQGGPPQSIRQLGARINSSASKLALSVRAVTEQLPPSTSEAQDDEKSAILAQRLTNFRQRVTDNARELQDLVDAFAQELDSNRALSTANQAQPLWTKQLEAILRSEDSPSAGIGRDSLSGAGSAAAWRGSGFVSPQAREAAALRLESMHRFSGAFNLSSEARMLLANGKEVMRRRPGQRVGEEVVNECVRPQLDDLQLQIMALLETVKAENSEQVASDDTPVLSAPTSGRRNATPALPSSAIAAILSHVKLVSVRMGTFLAIIEDLDFASTLDVDSSGSAATPATSKSWESLTVSAREGLHRFMSLKQASYDASSTLIMDAQDMTTTEAAHGRNVVEPEATQKLLATAQSLQELSREMLEATDDLLQIAEEQERVKLPYIGARARVYGVEEAAKSVGELFPSMDPVQRSAPQAGQRTTSLFSGSGGNRDRSTSVTTGGSMQSASVEGSRSLGASGAQVDADAESTRNRSTSSKIKKFFGDDSGAVAPSPPEGSTAGSTLIDRGDASSAASITAAKKRVQEEVPWFLGPDYAPEDIIMSAEGQVKGATLPALLERLTMHNTFDSAFNNTFLMTYRSFTTTHELLDMLLARFKIPPPSGLTPEEHQLWAERKQIPIRLRVFNVLKSWLEAFFYEGEDDEHLDRVKGFAQEMSYHSMELPSKQLMRLVERRQGDGEQMVRRMMMPNSAPPTILPKSLRKIKFLDIDPIEMARQLTLLDHKLYCKIKPVECLGKAWSKPDSDLHAKGIKDTISTSNRITGWVAEAILVQDDLKKRAAWIKHFIAIADACRSLNNFSTMTAIVSGLNSAPVYRLKRTWDSVNQRYVALHENVNRIMQSSKNFSDYREMIHKLQPPCVPFLGVYLTDLTFIEDGNSDRLKNDERLINFGKRQKTAEVIREIMIYQSTPYNLTPVAGIQRFIEDNLVESRGDTELYQQSLSIEPREREDERLGRLLAESGFL